MSDLPQKPLIAEFHVSIGETVKFSKTVSESDIYLFAGITGDFALHHVNEEYMRASAFGQRIAHGALLVGFMSTTSSMMIARCVEKGIDEIPVSLAVMIGYGSSNPYLSETPLRSSIRLPPSITGNAEQPRKLKSATSEAKWWQSVITS